MDETNELNLDLDQIQVEADSKLKIKDRFSKISEKATLANREKDEALLKVKAEEEKSINLAKERDFYKEFSATSSKYPQAGQYQDKILEKVRSGYSTEDAVVAVLNKEGKLGGSQAPISQDIAGGSAANIGTDKEKPMEQLTRKEKREQLMEAERRGDITIA